VAPRPTSIAAGARSGDKEIVNFTCGSFVDDEGTG
jgi:hypothetical protein